MLGSDSVGGRRSEKLELTRRGGVLVVAVGEDRLDSATAPRLKEAVLPRLESEPGSVVLDLTGVDLIDSTGLGALLSLLKRTGPDGELVLCGCCESVVDVLELTRLNRVFTLHPDVTTALARLGDARA